MKRFFLSIRQVSFQGIAPSDTTALTCHLLRSVLIRNLSAHSVGKRKYDLRKVSFSMKMTHVIPRLLTAKVSQSPKSIILLGPRQVGKSTLCRSLNPDLIVDLADQKQFQEHIKDPGLITRITNSLPDKALILIDEVQRIPSLLNSVQSLVDSVPQRLFLLTGSSARKLRRGKAEPSSRSCIHGAPVTAGVLGSKTEFRSGTSAYDWNAPGSVLQKVWSPPSWILRRYLSAGRSPSGSPDKGPRRV